MGPRQVLDLAPSVGGLGLAPAPPVLGLRLTLSPLPAGSQSWSREAPSMKALAVILAAVLTVPWPPQEPPPPPEMQRLATVLVGSWRTNEKHEPGQIAPTGGLGRGTATVRVGPGGRSLISDYTAVDPSGTFVGHSLMWWDGKAQAYRGVECYNRSGAGCELGLWRWEGPDLVSHEHGIKQVFTQFTPASHTYYMDGSRDHGALKRIMTIQFVRTNERRP